jgi:hypothetical protein
MIIYLTIFNSIVLLAVVLFGALFLYYKLVKNPNTQHYTEEGINPDIFLPKTSYVKVTRKKRKRRVNITQAAKLTGKSRTTIHRKINQGEIVIKDGVICKDDLKDLFKITNKKCGNCKTIKHISMFHKNKKHNDGLQSYCKVCNNTYNKSKNERLI